MGELVYATESVSPIWALLFPFFPVLIVLGFYFVMGGGFNDAGGTGGNYQDMGGGGTNVSMPGGNSAAMPGGDMGHGPTGDTAVYQGDYARFTVKTYAGNSSELATIISQNFVNILRKNVISAELYPDSVKLKKQMSYANNSGAKYTALVGEEEMKTKKITLKNMSNGTQESLSLKDLINKLK